MPYLWGEEKYWRLAFPLHIFTTPHGIEWDQVKIIKFVECGECWSVAVLSKVGNVSYLGLWVGRYTKASRLRREKGSPSIWFPMGHSAGCPPSLCEARVWRPLVAPRGQDIDLFLPLQHLYCLCACSVSVPNLSGDYNNASLMQQPVGGKKGPEEMVNSRSVSLVGNYFIHSVLRPVFGSKWLEQKMEGTGPALSDQVMSLSIGPQTMKNHTWAEKTWMKDQYSWRRFWLNKVWIAIFWESGQQ